MTPKKCEGLWHTQARHPWLTPGQYTRYCGTCAQAVTFTVPPIYRNPTSIAL